MSDDPSGQPKPEKSAQHNSLPQETLWQRLQRIFSTPIGQIVGFLGLVATLYALWDVWEQTSPEIHVVYSESSVPFAVPFSVRNPSSLFSMTNVEWVCHIGAIDGQGERGIFGGEVTLSARNKSTIEPKETANVYFEFGNKIMPGFGKIRRAIISISIKYKTLWLNRESKPVSMRWLETEPHWIEGPIVGIGR